MRSLARRTIALAILTACLATASKAQDPAAFTTQPTQTQIDTWLRSDDSRLMAWGATYALQSQDLTLIPQLAYLATNWQPFPRDPVHHFILERGGTLLREEAMGAVLDALLQMHASLSPDTIQKLSADFPVQAVLLLSRMSTEDAQPVLLALYQNSISEEVGSYLLLRSVAAMLALHPPPGFAASIFTAIVVRAEIPILSPGQNAPSLGMGWSCSAGGESPLPQGWPEIDHYILLDESATMPSGAFLVVPGIRPIYAQRTVHPPSDTGINSDNGCGRFARLSDTVRFDLLAQMLEVKPTEMGWKATVQKSIYFENAAQYQAEITAFVAGQETQFHATATALQAKGLLTPEETATSRPKLLLQIEDQRRDKAAPLPPALFFQDTRVLAWSGLNLPQNALDFISK